MGTEAQLLETLAPFGEALECGVCELREALEYPAMPPTSVSAPGIEDDGSDGKSGFYWYLS